MQSGGTMSKSSNPKRDLRIFISFALYLLGIASFFIFLELERQSGFGIITWKMPDGSIGGIELTVTLAFCVTVISLVVFLASMFQEWRSGVFKKTHRS